MSHPLNVDITELAHFLVGAQEELTAHLSEQQAIEFSTVVERFANGLLTDDPDAQSDAWLAARTALRKFQAFAAINDDKRKFFEPEDEPKPQTAQEVVPSLIACAKKIRESKAATAEKPVAKPGHDIKHDR